MAKNLLTAWQRLIGLLQLDKKDIFTNILLCNICRDSQPFTPLGNTSNYKLDTRSTNKYIMDYFGNLSNLGSRIRWSITINANTNY